MRIAIFSMLTLITSAAVLAQGNAQLVILRAQVDLDNDLVFLEGQSFIAGKDPLPSVTLSGFPMTVVGAPTDTQLVFAIPDGLAPGTYLVTVSRGNTSAKNDVFSMTVGGNGPRGPAGEKGDTGAIGPEGPQGLEGSQGPEGPPGPQGETGAAGAIGAQGPQGETGATGPQGAAGATGPQGAPGPQGATGPQGAQGPQGLIGIGVQGPQGPQGPTGPQGPAGTSANVKQIGASVDMSFSVDDRFGWNHIEAIGAGDDACSDAIPLGFTFNGFGANTTAVKLSTNGVLFFGNTCNPSITNHSLPSGMSTDPMLFFFWDDLKDYGAGEFVDYATLGSAGARVFNMYFRYRLFSSGCGSNQVNVMISVHESSNLVTARYSSLTGCSDIRGASATFGFQAAGGSSAEAFNVSTNSPQLDDQAPTNSMSFRPQQ